MDTNWSKYLKQTQACTHTHTSLKFQSVIFQLYQLHSFSIAVKQITTNLEVWNMNSLSHSFCAFGVWVQLIRVLCSRSALPQSMCHWVVVLSGPGVHILVGVGKNQFLLVLLSFSLLVVSRGSLSVPQGHLHCFAMWHSITTWQLVSLSPAGEFLALVCKDRVTCNVTQSKWQSHHLCYVVDSNQDSDYLATLLWSFAYKYVTILPTLKERGL